jgi:hypothetical protein
MGRTSLALALLASCVVYINADCYLHNPRGSNNRLNEKSANRANANRAFDSQNNNRGGYNVGDKTDKAAGNDYSKQYQMEYFMSGVNSGDITKMLIEWTNQHGCGGNEDNNPHKLNCNLVVQYMTEDAAKAAKDVAYTDAAKYKMRDGLNTNQQNFNAAASQNKDGVRTYAETQAQYANRKNGNVDQNKVYHEPHEWYDKCQARNRNNGLFTADQNVNQNRASHTRQNPGGTRRGYECPEERDYYPYWHPTPWKDMVIMTKHTDKCGHYKTESFNVKPKGECVEKWQGSTTNDRHYSGAETPKNCATVGGTWVDFYNYLEVQTKITTKAECEGSSTKKVAGFRYKWAIPYRHSANNRRAEACLVLLDAPECVEAPWSRHNHLGNGADLKPLRYEWKLPRFPHSDSQKFVLRIRYNISTDDYDPFNTDSKFNGEDKSPVTQNPLVDVGDAHPLRLAINTAQFGRTFQDRTHTSFLKSRPAEIATGIIHNLNVRGKRGNIVQTFPAVEYDYIPRHMSIRQDEKVHVQWTGSNTHNNGNPAGDGQAGDAGQGTGGTDRANIVGLGAVDDNFPEIMESTNSICHHITVLWEKEGKHATTSQKWYDICLKLGSAGKYDCKTGCTKSLDAAGNNKMDNLLNNAPASFSGMVIKFKTKRTFHYMCTRNNAFTNRSQKGTIIVQ